MEPAGTHLGPGGVHGRDRHPDHAGPSTRRDHGRRALGRGRHRLPGPGVGPRRGRGQRLVRRLPAPRAPRDRDGGELAAARVDPRALRPRRRSGHLGVLRDRPEPADGLADAVVVRAGRRLRPAAGAATGRRGARDAHQHDLVVRGRAAADHPVRRPHPDRREGGRGRGRRAARPQRRQRDVARPVRRAAVVAHPQRAQPGGPRGVVGERRPPGVGAGPRRPVARRHAAGPVRDRSTGPSSGRSGRSC